MSSTVGSLLFSSLWCGQQWAACYFQACDVVNSGQPVIFKPVMWSTVGSLLFSSLWCGQLWAACYFQACDVVNCGQPAMRKLAYSEAGQTLASVNEWEASEAYL